MLTSLVAALSLAGFAAAEAPAVPEATPMVVALNNAPVTVIEDVSEYLYATKEEAETEMTAAVNLLRFNNYVILRSYAEQYYGVAANPDAKWRYKIYFVPSNSR